MYPFSGCRAMLRGFSPSTLTTTPTADPLSSRVTFIESVVAQVQYNSLPYGSTAISNGKYVLLEGINAGPVWVPLSNARLIDCALPSIWKSIYMFMTIKGKRRNKTKQQDMKKRNYYLEVQ